MKPGQSIIYNHFEIYLNNFGEHCVCRKLTGSMVTYNSSFKKLEQAKKFINIINPIELDKSEIEKIADKLKI